MSSNQPNILFLTNSELGQANVSLAVAEEFLFQGEFRVHIASFKPLAASVEALNRRCPSIHSALFHEIDGPCMEDLAIRSHVGLIHHKPGVIGTAEGFQKVNRAMSSWKSSEYTRAYQRCLDILKVTQPGVAVLDPLLHVGLDACQHLTTRLVVLWPVPPKDIVILNQPNARVLWHYPMVGSGYSYPLPWTSILPNMYLVLRAAISMSTRNPPERPSSLNKEEGKSPFPLKNAYSKESLHLTPAFPQMDFPLHIPSNVICCGPILRRHSSLSEVDPEMQAWLKQKTILISLGSHVRPSETVAVEMAKAIRVVLNKHTQFQVLWKLRYDWQESAAFRKVLGTFIDEGSVMIVPWIQAEIISVLETGKIAVYVHHGGANSYFEACKYLFCARVGAPQVILPQWLDTYDCATRVEWLGIGVHGSRKSAPGIEATEFALAMDKVICDERIHLKSDAIRDLCKTTEGRILAYDKILEFAR
ncbi:hypothetical protein N7488_004330 [Penicillium malachiteum]|nr:hypothetical protein N7488_004330 [Penicillium malachiteum]